MAVPPPRFIGTVDPKCLNLGENLFIPYMGYQPPPVDKFEGPAIELMKILSEKLNFCYYFTHYHRLTVGRLLQNGTWTDGIVRKVIEKEFEFTVTPIAVTRERLQAVDISHYINIDEHVILTKYPTFTSDYTGFLKPFSLLVWISVLAIIVAFTLTLWFTSRTKKSISRGNNEEGKEHSGLSYTFVFTLRLLLAQDLPKMSFSKLIIGLWLLTALILGTVYKGNLKAALIAPKLQVPFRNMEELADFEEVTPMIVEQTTFQALALASEPESAMGRIIRRIQFEINPNIMIRKILSGKFAFILQRDSLLYLVDTVFSNFGTCGLTVTKQEGIIPVSLGLAFQKNSPWKPKVDKVLSRLVESGIMRKLIDDYNINATYCLSPENQAITLEPLKLSDMYGVLMLFFGGVTLGTIIFISEVLFGITKDCCAKKEDPKEGTESYDSQLNFRQGINEFERDSNREIR